MNKIEIKGKEVEFFEGVSTLRASSMISQAIESSLGAGGGSMSKIIYDASFVVNYVISVSNLLEVFPEYGDMAIIDLYDELRKDGSDVAIIKASNVMGEHDEISPFESLVEYKELAYKETVDRLNSPAIAIASLFSELEGMLNAIKELREPIQESQEIEEDSE